MALNEREQQNQELGINVQDYPILATATSKLAYNKNALLDREDTLESIRAILHKSEMSNVLLMGEAGQGKTAVMQEFAKRYAKEYLVLTTSVPQLTDETTGNVSRNFKQLFDDLAKYRKYEINQRKIVLFIDEFHVLPKESPAAVEDLKPTFARSGEKGIYLVGATTYQEYHDDIEPNEAFKQRFDIVKLPTADDNLTYKILKERMRHDYSNIRETQATDRILREIIQYTDDFVKDSEQPRKATNVLDEMMGWQRIGKPFNHDLLVKLFALNKNIHLDLQTNPDKLEKYIKSRVYNQDMAISALLHSAYTSILNLNDPHKPRSIMLFVGSTGTGKTELAKAFTQGMFGEDAHLTIFDMSEYQGENSIKRFQYNLTDTVLSTPTPVILLDEIDRCEDGINELLFSVFDEARLHDRYGREVNFSNIFFIMTTNSTDEITNEIAGNNYTVERMNAQMQKFNALVRRGLIRKGFPAPLLGRINDFIVFIPMSAATNKLIAKRNLREIQAKCLTAQNVKVRYDMVNVMKYITDENLDQSAEAGGARQIVNLINNNILSAIATYIIKHPNVYDIKVTTTGQMRSNNKNILESTADIKVEATDQDTLNQDYNRSVQKFKPEVERILNAYIAHFPDLQLPAHANKEIFMALAHNSLLKSPKEAVGSLFKPLRDYLIGVRSWDELYGKNPAEADYPRPTTDLELQFEKDQMIVLAKDHKTAKTTV